MHQTSMCRVLGLAAVGALALSTAALPLGDGTAQAETAEAGTAAAATAWSVTTDTLAGLVPIGGGGFVAYVPYNICAVDWTLIGGQGGAGSGAAAGEAGGELRVTTQRTAGKPFLLHPGPAGQPWVAGAAGGMNGTDAAGAPGVSDGVGGGGGGGGAGSALRFAGMDLLVAHGGDGSGYIGGAGGSVRPGPSGNAVIPLGGDALPLDTTFDGSTSEPGGSGRSGAGVITGVGVPCPATPPGAPYLMAASSYPEDGVIQLIFQPTAPRSHQVWSAVTGWEVTLDGGVTWQSLPVTAAPEGVLRRRATPDGALQAFVRGLADGNYQVAVRATSELGPSAPTDLRDVRLLSTPRRITVTDVSVTAGISSLRVSWTPPEGAVDGGYVAESYDAAQEGEGTPSAMCETAFDVHSCVLAAEPGRSYRVVVMGGGGRASAPVTSGVVAAPPVPTQLPASSGALQVLAGGALSAGDAVDVAGSGYLPGSTVTVVVYSTPVVLDSVATADDGSFDTSVTLPAGLPAGAHTLVATGVDPDGETWTLTQAITAGAADAGAGPVAVQSAAPTARPATATARPATARPAAAGLAYTGADIGLPVIGGLIAVAVGVGLLFVGRRRRAAE